MPNTTNRLLKVFLCHASDDKPVVRQLYKFLCKNGVDAWLDEEKLLPGQDWKLEIPKAIQSADVILVCLSRNSITKEGYIQREIKFALDVADEKPDGTIFIIPARLEDCNVPERISRWQWVDLRREDGTEKLIRSLTVRAEGLGLASLIRAASPTAQRNASPAHTAEPNVKKQEAQVVRRTGVAGVRAVWAEIEFVQIPTGEFIMGSKLANEFASDDESPRHTVNIPYDYWIGRFPVTNAQFAEFIEWTHYGFKWIDGWKKVLNHPVVNVTWKDARAYLAWLNDIQGKDLPKDLLFRLPTEAEWEKAARGVDGREWPWGNAFGKGVCNSQEGGKNGTTPVGAYSPQGDSIYGASDMAGNVWEWTGSLYRPYPYKHGDGREDEIASGLRVLRGGSFNLEARDVRCASRSRADPGNIAGSLGFRVVVAPRLS